MPKQNEWVVDALIPLRYQGKSIVDDSVVTKILSAAMEGQFKMFPQGLNSSYYPAVPPEEIQYFLNLACCFDALNCNSQSIFQETNYFLKIRFAIHVMQQNKAEIQGVEIVVADPGGVFDNVNLFYIPRSEFNKIKVKANHDLDFVSWLNTFNYAWIPLHIETKNSNHSICHFKNIDELNQMCKLIYSGTQEVRSAYIHQEENCDRKSMNNFNVLKLFE